MTGQVMAVIGALVGVRLLTELMIPAEYGELALGMTVVTLVNQVMLWPLRDGATRFYALAVEQGALTSYLTAVRRLIFLAIGIVVLIIVLSITGLLIVGRTQWIALVVASLIFAILSGYSSILTGIQNAARQRSIAALHQGIESWARFMVAAGMILLLGASSTVAMIGYGVALIPVICSQLLFFRKINPIRSSSFDSDYGISWRNRICTYSWPLAAWGILIWAQLSSDRWALKLFATNQEVGFYAVLFQLGFYPITIATGMAIQFLTPIFYQRAGDTSDGKRKANVHMMGWRLTWLALVITGVAFLIALLFHVPIFRFIVAKEYAAVSYLLPWMILAGGIFAAGDTITLTMMSQMETHIMIVPKIVTGLLGVIFNFVGAYWCGTAGIVIAFLMFSILNFFWLAGIAKRRVDVNENYV